MTAANRAVRERAEQASVYLYGSVATGQARIGKSDVDLLSLDPPRSRQLILESDS